MIDVHKTLFNLGYTDTIIYESNLLDVKKKDIKLNAGSLFFVDAGYKIKDHYIFALSAFVYEARGILVLSHEQYTSIMSSSYQKKFDIPIASNPLDDVVIKRQYGMRKILKSEFDESRYILKKGYPDFPTCPYGHTYKMLGYDTQENEYVRFTSSILKDTSLKTLKYKGTL